MASKNIFFSRVRRGKICSVLFTIKTYTVLGLYDMEPNTLIYALNELK